MRSFEILKSLGAPSRRPPWYTGAPVPRPSARRSEPYGDVRAATRAAQHFARVPPSLRVGPADIHVRQVRRLPRARARSARSTRRGPGCTAAATGWAAGRIDLPRARQSPSDPDLRHAMDRAHPAAARHRASGGHQWLEASRPPGSTPLTAPTCGERSARRRGAHAPSAASRLSTCAPMKATAHRRRSCSQMQKRLCAMHRMAARLLAIVGGERAARARFRRRVGDKGLFGPVELSFGSCGMPLNGRSSSTRTWARCSRSSATLRCRAAARTSASIGRRSCAGHAAWRRRRQHLRQRRGDSRRRRHRCACRPAYRGQARRARHRKHAHYTNEQKLFLAGKWKPRGDPRGDPPRESRGGALRRRQPARPLRPAAQDPRRRPGLKGRDRDGRVARISQADTSFSLTFDTAVDDFAGGYRNVAFITEKIMKPLLNLRPVVMVGAAGALAIAESHGFNVTLGRLVDATTTACSCARRASPPPSTRPTASAASPPPTGSPPSTPSSPTSATSTAAGLRVLAAHARASNSRWRCGRMGRCALG